MVLLVLYTGTGTVLYFFVLAEGGWPPAEAGVCGSVESPRLDPEHCRGPPHRGREGHPPPHLQGKALNSHSEDLCSLAESVLSGSDRF